MYAGFVRKLSRKKFEFEVHYIDLVHQMHAACGFYNSGFETTACVIADGAGSFLEIEGIETPAYEFETIFKVSYQETLNLCGSILEQKLLDLIY